MKFLSGLLRFYNINLQPSNSEHIDIESARRLLYPGAHIAAGNLHEHFHHGIVVDLTATDISIVHFWGSKKRDARVQTTTLPIFVAGSSQNVGIRNRHLYIINYQDDTLDKRQETSERAKEMLDQPDQYKYHMFKLNCESFAYFCRTQRWTSEQVAIMRKFPAKKTNLIYKKAKKTTRQHANDVLALYKAIPTDGLSSNERENLKQLCRDYTLSM